MDFARHVEYDGAWPAHFLDAIAERTFDGGGVVAVIFQIRDVIDRAASAADGIFAIAFRTGECQVAGAECPECALADFAIGHLFIDAPVVCGHRGESADGIAVARCIAYFREAFR